MVVDIIVDKLYVFIIILYTTYTGSWLRYSTNLLGLSLAFQLRQWQSGSLKFVWPALLVHQKRSSNATRLSLSEIILARLDVDLDLTNVGLAIGWAGELL